jgi:hypothetical protein
LSAACHSRTASRAGTGTTARLSFIARRLFFLHWLFSIRNFPGRFIRGGFNQLFLCRLLFRRAAGTRRRGSRRWRL